jgi:hypothetical protein
MHKDRNEKGQRREIGRKVILDTQPQGQVRLVQCKCFTLKITLVISYTAKDGEV